MRTIGMAVLACCLLSAAGASAGEWPTYLYDNARRGAAPDGVAVPLAEGWAYRAPAEPRLAWSGDSQRVIEGQELRHRVKYDETFHVAVSDGRVYFGSSVDHQLYCLDAASGRTLWTFFTGGPIRLAPTVWKGRVYFGSDDGHVYCLDGDSGRPVWSRRAAPDEEWLLARGEMISRWPVRTGVLIEDGIAYFGAGIFPHEDVFLHAVQAETGDVVWTRDDISESDAGRDDLSPQGYLLAEGERLFVPSGRSLPAAFDRTTGRFLHKRIHGWRGDAGGAVGGYRALLSDGQIYAAGPHHMLALTQEKGDVGFGWIEGRQMVVAGDAAYVADGKHVSRLDRPAYAENSRKRHAVQTKINGLSRQLRSAKGDQAEKLREEVAELRQQHESLAAGGVVWQTETPCESSLIVAGDVVLAGGPEQVAAFRTDDGRQIWSGRVEGDAVGLAVAGGRLFVSTTKGTIHCFAPGDEPRRSQSDRANVEAADPYPADEWTPIYAAAAEQILEQSGIKEGFCLVIGSEDGRLAWELARRSQLKFYGVEPDEEKVEAARRALTAAGLYGHRITIHHADPSAIPYSNYFADLVVSDSLLRTGQIPGNLEQAARHVKPLGGMVALGRPENAPGGNVSAATLKEWLEGTQLGEQASIEINQIEIDKPTGRGPWAWGLLTRGALPGAGNWSHLYGDAGNTGATSDHLVKGGLGVLWYGDPGPGRMVNRHEGAVGPLAVDGRLIVQTEDSVEAYDAYNGRFLWERKNPEAIRTGVFQNHNPGNLVAGGGSLFIMVRDECFELDAATGDVKATHRLPKEKDDGTREWGYVGWLDGVLFGTATVRKELEQRLRRRGRVTEDATDALFAIDTRTGEHLWTHEGQSVTHHTIALGPDRVYFIDSSITPGQRADLLRRERSRLETLTGEAARLAEERLKRLDVRTAVALDARTGEQVWAQPVDVADCSEIGIGGGQLTMLYQNNVLLLCGANYNGHFWTQFVNGEFSRRRLLALTAETGERLWDVDGNYRHRPIIIEDRVIAEPWGFDLYTGQQLTREHPLTGESVPWSIIRPGHHCGMLTGCPSMLMFRSGSTGFYDLELDAGTRHFAGHRLGCWINAIPANGLVMVPEASAGCVCLFSIASTITLEPREPRRPWSIFSAIGASTPVKHMALNFGAPGDRKDARGTAWLAYPRPVPGRHRTSLDLPLELGPKFLPVDGRIKSPSYGGGAAGFTSLGSRSTEIAGTETPWLYGSWAWGLSRLTVPLLGEGDPAAVYRVRLHFAELDDEAEPGDRIFHVRIQGKTVLKDIDPAADAQGRRTAVIREVDGIRVTDTLQIELVPKADQPGPKATPVLNALEIIRTEFAAESP